MKKEKLKTECVRCIFFYHNLPPNLVAYRSNLGIVIFYASCDDPIGLSNILLLGC